MNKKIFLMDLRVPLVKKNSTSSGQINPTQIKMCALLEPKNVCILSHTFSFKYTSCLCLINIGWPRLFKTTLSF